MDRRQSSGNGGKSATNAPVIVSAVGERPFVAVYLKSNIQPLAD